MFRSQRSSHPNGVPLAPLTQRQDEIHKTSYNHNNKTRRRQRAKTNVRIHEPASLLPDVDGGGGGGSAAPLAAAAAAATAAPRGSAAAPRAADFGPSPPAAAL